MRLTAPSVAVPTQGTHVVLPWSAARTDPVGGCCPAMERTNPAELSIFVTAGTEVSDSLSADVPTCRLPPTEPAARLAFPWEGGHTRVRPDETS